MANDPLSDAMNVIKTHEMAGRDHCIVKPASKVIMRVLEIFKERGYISGFEFNDNGKSGSITVKLLGRINKCGTIKPRFAINNSEWAKWEQRYIPGKGFGVIIVST